MQGIPSGKTVAGSTGSFFPLTSRAKVMFTNVASGPGVTASGTGVSMDEGRPATGVSDQGVEVGVIVAVGVALAVAVAVGVGVAVGV